MTSEEIKAAIDEIAKRTGHVASILLEQQENPATGRSRQFWRCEYVIDGKFYQIDDNDPAESVKAALDHVRREIKQEK